MKRSTEQAITVVSLLMLAGRFSRAVSSKRSPGAPGSARERWDPLGVRKRTAAAIASGNPATMRALATLLRSEGYAAEAAELEAAASAAERSRS